MTILKIVQWPSKVLKLKSRPVKKISKDILLLLDNMIETMKAESGIGLSAIQVGKPLRLVTINLDPKNPDSPNIYMINPEIIHRSEERVLSPEGCLSVKENAPSCINVPRHSSIKVTFLDRDGKKILLSAHGLLSICIQHEIDHLNGITLMDYIDLEAN